MAPGKEVEVSGYLDDNRGIRATFLEKKDASLLEYEVTGFAENLDDHLKTFMINSLTVNYTLIADALAAGILANGLYIEVTGTFDVGRGEMHAAKIDLGDELDVEEGRFLSRKGGRRGAKSPSIELFRRLSGAIHCVFISIIKKEDSIMRKLMYFLTSVMAVMMLTGFSIGIAQAGPCELPVFDVNNFDTNSQSPTYSANITNPYLPLMPGTVFKYEPVPNDENVVDTMIVTGTIKTITLDGDSIDCLQVHDFETVDGVLSEDTFDWYAQDFEGNVWYCGEDTTEYLEGGGIDKTGSWEAGQDVSGLGVDALPGYVMLASQKSGECYQQESYPSEAEDKAKIMRLNAKVELDNGDSYVDCLETKEWSPLELGAIEQKNYAKGVGLVLNFEHHGKRVRNELISVTSP